MYQLIDNTISSAITDNTVNHLYTASGKIEATVFLGITLLTNLNTVL